ncbi:OsmC family protein [Desulfuromonas carbonis]|uniref:OsmC family protein n=1 Tax=Desulfuromonas sp. DDH964 TaxID=1823759 RepID=UPI00078D1CCB|nr:OsmC family protein [Desulfuromonas sp. DDH964]AMV73493.1 osmotically inducible protein OsmC [Desulfuromonas sp. DDH964]
MEITFPGGLAVEARYKGFTVRCDQPEAAGGKNSAPSPFDLFLISLGNCAGYFALRFCQQRDLPTAGLRLTLTSERDPEQHRLARVQIVIELPEGFPDKYRAAIIRATDQCTVKRTIFDPPDFEVTTA